MNKRSRGFACYLLAFLVSLSCTSALSSESSGNMLTPIKVSLCPGVELPNTNCNVFGLSLGIIQFPPGVGIDQVYGIQFNGLFSVANEMYGAQVSGLGSGIIADGVGFQISPLFNIVGNSFSGIQVGLFNMTMKKFRGIQVGLMNWDCNDVAGIQLGFSNGGDLGPSWKEHHRAGNLSYGNYEYPKRSENMRGIQLGILNSAIEMRGVQCGLLWNDAKHAKGIQVGMLNTAQTMTGIQIGIVNYINESPVSCLPIINAHF